MSMTLASFPRDSGGRIILPPATLKRFWSKVDDSAGADACWPWRGAWYKGYGVLWMGERTNQKAHRVSYALLVGPIPEGLLVRHLCGYRPCVNPRHLVPGTALDNARDKKKHGPVGHRWTGKIKVVPTNKGLTRPSLAERFWSKVNKTDDCWLWTASRNPGGYGQIGVAGKKHPIHAHRVAYELTYGPIPEGLCVLHSCDVRLCVRPSHLRAGTISDNNWDAVLRGRHRQNSEKQSVAMKRHLQEHPEHLERLLQGRRNHPEKIPRGERNKNAKLTDEQARSVYQRRCAGQTCRSLGAEYGISASAVCAIGTKHTWRHIHSTE